MFTIQKKNDNTKVLTKTAVVTLDTIGKRYGKLPSELLKLDLNDYTFNLVIANAAIKEENRLQKEAQRRAKLNAPKRRR